jgi:hypothetical protein
VPFLAYVRAGDDDPRPPDGPRPWEPDWRVWRWVAPAVPVGYAITRTDGALKLVLVLALFALACRCVDELLPDGGGLREHRQ